MFGHVVPNVVGHHHHHCCLRAKVVLHDVTDRSIHGSSGGSATHEALLSEQLACHFETLLIWALDPLVNHAVVQHTGDEVIPNAFGLLPPRPSRVLVVQALWTSKDRTIRVYTHNYDSWVQLLELASNPSDGSASPSP